MSFDKKRMRMICLQDRRVTYCLFRACVCAGKVSLKQTARATRRTPNNDELLLYCTVRSSTARGCLFVESGPEQCGYALQRNISQAHKYSSRFRFHCVTSSVWMRMDGLGGPVFYDKHYLTVRGKHCITTHDCFRNGWLIIIAWIDQKQIKSQLLPGYQAVVCRCRHPRTNRSAGGWWSEPTFAALRSRTSRWFRWAANRDGCSPWSHTNALMSRCTWPIKTVKTNV